LLCILNCKNNLKYFNIRVDHFRCNKTLEVPEESISFELPSQSNGSPKYFFTHSGSQTPVKTPQVRVAVNKTGVSRRSKSVNDEALPEKYLRGF